MVANCRKKRYYFWSTFQHYVCVNISSHIMFVVESQIYLTAEINELCHKYGSEYALSFTCCYDIDERIIGKLDLEAQVLIIY